MLLFLEFIIFILNHFFIIVFNNNNFDTIKLKSKYFSKRLERAVEYGFGFCTIFLAIYFLC